jgi:hypothetical protein
MKILDAELSMKYTNSPKADRDPGIVASLFHDL